MFDTQRNNKVNYIGNKKVNLNELSYKLPEPKYYGYPVQQIKLLLRSYFIYDTVSINEWSLVVKWHNMSSCPIMLNQKSQVLNEFLKFEYPDYLKQSVYDLPHIEFVISSNKPEGKVNSKFLVGYLPIVNLHKDYVYSE